MSDLELGNPTQAEQNYEAYAQGLTDGAGNRCQSVAWSCNKFYVEGYVHGKKFFDKALNDAGERFGIKH